MASELELAKQSTMVGVSKECILVQYDDDDDDASKSPVAVFLFPQRAGLFQRRPTSGQKHVIT